MNSKKFTTYSALPVYRSRSTGFWVATPTGQVSRWQTRIMMQPETTSGAVAKPNSSAPSSAAIDDVAAGLELAVGLHDDPVAQAVEQQRLLGLGEAELPRTAGVLERGQRRRAGAAVVAGDQHDVGVRLGDARRDRADADLGDQLHVHARRAGWRSSGRGSAARGPRSSRCRGAAAARSGPTPGVRVPGLGHPRVDLVAGQLAALAGLRALRHLDLDVVGVGEVLRR